MRTKNVKQMNEIMYNSRDSIIVKLILIYYYKSREAMMYKYYSWKFTLGFRIIC